MAFNLRRLLLGKPLATEHASHERLSIPLALPIFASDALSSVAYATESILLQLAGARLGTNQFYLALPVGIGIVTLILLVVLSYRQIIYAYPNGGGAYIVARENIGEFFGLVAAAALLVDYVMTAAVSIAESVAASFSALEQVGHFEHLPEYRVLVCLLLLGLVTLANLRGVRESGLLFAVPSYLFILSMLGLVFFGGLRALSGQPPVQPVAPPHTVPDGMALGSLSLFLILRAFSSGCSALTGIEAVSNGVPVFKAPEPTNAVKTLVILGGLLTVLFVGITWLANHFNIVPSPYWHQYGLHRNGEETVISQIARATFGVGLPYYVIQAATALILFLAANTSFAAFPRLASLLAESNYLPHQLNSLGERLAFNNGIILLGGAAAALLFIFKGETYALLPLYTVGVFIAFSLSQGGMVLRAMKRREYGWGFFVNAFGGIITLIVLCIVTYSKFWVTDERATLFHIGGFAVKEGAWLALMMMGLVIWLFYAIAKHYTRVSFQLAQMPMELDHTFQHTVVVLVPSRLHRGVVQAINYGRSLSPNALAVHIAFDPSRNASLEKAWNEHGGDMPLLILESPYRKLVGPLMNYLDAADRVRSDDLITVILPEFVPAKWWHQFLHNASGLILRQRLLRRRNTVLVNVRYYLDE